MTAPLDAGPPLSIPARTQAPRALTAAELKTLGAVADALIPAARGTPAATSEPGFSDQLAVALDARADAFAAIVDRLGRLRSVPAADMFPRLEQMHLEDEDAFQALSTVVAGAWLLTLGVRERLGYHGQRSDKADLDEVADEILSGVLDPVLDRDPATGPHWVR